MSSDSWRVRIRTAAAGLCSLICGKALRPSRFGIEMSRRTKSGLSSAAFSMASMPSAASPHTTHPSCFSMMVRRMLRICGSSSTIKMCKVTSGPPKLVTASLSEPGFQKKLGVHLSTFTGKTQAPRTASEICLPFSPRKTPCACTLKALWRPRTNSDSMRDGEKTGFGATGAAGFSRASARAL